jgi:hypothetical protein
MPDQAIWSLPPQRAYRDNAGALGYAEGWDWKRAWYARNGYEVGRNLFTTSEIGGLDMRGVEATVKAVQAALA